ncbi:hypothetical protein E2C01_080714 [Portunus trituberculatus]|uniref:Uncharacterized protein n=1 Tax=Portunus trituberculatus TaxID=210409 RepID=A0A5B7IKC8_PORTR|nr:hypothetical protein [Portunus trituberculatus]
MTHHTPRPSHCHEVSPLTPKGPSSTCQCLVHGTQRALVHSELFSTVPSQAREPCTPYRDINIAGVKCGVPRVVSQDEA